MPCTPVALYKAPCASHVHSIPRVSEPVVLKPDSRLVPSGLAVALDDNTVESRIAEDVKMLLLRMLLLCDSDDKFQSNIVTQMFMEGARVNTQGLRVKLVASAKL